MSSFLPDRGILSDSLAAGVPAAVLSGLPSTLHALVLKRDPLEATLAAGSILLPRERSRKRLLMAALPVHLGLSTAWSIVLTILLPRRDPLTEGTVAGLAIAALDLGIAGRRWLRIQALPTLPQVADHIAFGIIVAAVLSRRPRASAT